MTKLKEYKMYINGAWVDAENKKTFKSFIIFCINPRSVDIHFIFFEFSHYVGL